MPRNWTKLCNLGPHGIEADGIFGAIGKVVKNGGVLKTAESNRVEAGELIPPLPKGMQPANLKLRYLLYCLALSPDYALGQEVDPSRKVAAKTMEICEEIARACPGYKIPGIYDERMRDAIIHLVASHEHKLLSGELERQITDSQNILRFLRENRDME